jgi:tetratricopeptide (TPR) repeat protein
MMSAMARRTRRSASPTRARIAATAIAAAATASSLAAHADVPRTAPKASAAEPANVTAAKKHAERAHDLYAQGSYRESIAELEEALKLDPSAKELVSGLAVVHERLGDVDDALKYFRQHAAMDLTPEEREKTEAAIRRLEGAKREIEAKQEAERQRLAEEQRRAERDKPPVEQPVAHGRIDAWTIGAGVVSVAGFGFGIAFGMKALANKPQSGFITGQDGTYGDLQNKASSAHKDAMISDVGFGFGFAGGVAAALLYALRTKQPTQAPQTGKSTTSLSAAPIPGGGALLVHGAF